MNTKAEFIVSSDYYKIILPIRYLNYKKTNAAIFFPVVYKMGSIITISKFNYYQLNSLIIYGIF